MMRRTVMMVGLGVSAALLASGCQLAGGDGGAQARPSHTSQVGDSAPATASPQAAAATSGAPRVTKSVTKQVPGKQGATFTIGYSGLRVKGQLAVLTLVWTPHGIGTDTFGMYDLVGQDTPGSTVTLIDKANLKRYVVVSDSDNHSLHTDTVTAKTGNNQPMTTTFWFAAPPANADLDVTLGDQPIFESVQVTR